MRATLQAQTAALAPSGGYPHRTAAPRRSTTTHTATTNAASLLLLENYKLRYPMVDQRASPSHGIEHMAPPSEEDLLMGALNSATHPPQQPPVHPTRTRDFLTSLLLSPYEAAASPPTPVTPSPEPNTLISALARFGASKLVEQQLGSPAPLFHDGDPLADDMLQLRLSHAATRTRLQPSQLSSARGNISRAAIGSQAHGPAGANVFVFHIPNEWDETDLAVLFAQYGTILSARIATDKSSGRRLGFGFISFTKIADACVAVQALNGFSVAGKRLKVTVKRGEQHVAAQFAPHLHFGSEIPSAPDNNNHPTNPPSPADRGRSAVAAHNNDSCCWTNTNKDPPATTPERERSHSVGKPSSGKGSASNPTTTDRVPTDTSTGGNTDCTVSSQCARCSDGGTGAASRRRRRRRKARTAEESTTMDLEDDGSVFNGDTHSPPSTSVYKADDGAMDIESVFAQVLKRFTDEEDSNPITHSSSCVDDENWLELLTALLRAPQGRRFMFTLLKAAGLVYGPTTD